MPEISPIIYFALGILAAVRGLVYWERNRRPPDETKQLK